MKVKPFSASVAAGITTLAAIGVSTYANENPNMYLASQGLIIAAAACWTKTLSNGASSLAQKTMNPEITDKGAGLAMILAAPLAGGAIIAATTTAPYPHSVAQYTGSCLRSVTYQPVATVAHFAGYKEQHTPVDSIALVGAFTMITGARRLTRSQQHYRG